MSRSILVAGAVVGLLLGSVACGGETATPESLYMVSCDAITCSDASETYSRSENQEGCAWYCQVPESAMAYETYRIEVQKDSEGCFQISVDEVIVQSIATFQNGTTERCEDFE